MSDGASSGARSRKAAEAVDRQQLGDVGALLGVLERGDLGQLAVLGRELGRGRDLDRVGLAERALREGREPAQRLDLVVEQVDAHRALLGGRVEVEDAAADGELAAVVDLVDALVAGGHELLADLVEVEQVADARWRSACGRSAGSGTFSLSATALTTTTGGSSPLGALGEQRVERGDAQADEVRRRREVRLVGDAAARVEAHGPRAPATRAGRRRGRAPGGRRPRRRASGGRRAAPSASAATR